MNTIETLPRVVVTGGGTVIADNNTGGEPGEIIGRDEFEKRILSGKPIIGISPEYMQNYVPGLFGNQGIGAYFREDFDPLSPDILPSSLTSHLKEPRASFAAKLSVAAAYHAIRDSGLSPEHLNGNEIGAAISNSNGPAETLENALKEVLFREEHPDDKSHRRAYTAAMAGTTGNGLSDEIVRVTMKALGIYGTPINNQTGCASSVSNLISAFDTIRMGRARKMLFGGVDIGRSKVWLSTFKSANVLAKSYPGNPSLSSRPGDIDRTGLVFTSGSNVYMIERLDDVRKDKRENHIIGEMLAGTSKMDAEGVTESSDHRALNAAIFEALTFAGLGQTGTDVILPHMTGTASGDVLEAEAILLYNPNSIVYPGKDRTGHGFARSGTDRMAEMGLIFRDKIIPEPINLKTPGTRYGDKIIYEPLNQILWSFPENVINRNMNTLAVHSKGMQGTNAVAVFARYNGE